MAKIQEKFLSRCTKGVKSVTYNPLPTVPSQVPNRSLMPLRRVSPEKMKERREQGLCYHCEEKWTLRHKCTKPTLYLLDGVDFGVNEPT